MYKNIIIILFILYLLTSLCFAANWEAKDYVTYYGTTDHSITVAWSPVDGATSYKVREYFVEQKRYLPIISGITSTQISITLPKSGHYIFEVAAVNSYSSSAWARSVDATYAVVNNKPRSWWIYGHIASPGSIVISRVTGLNNPDQIGR